MRADTTRAAPATRQRASSERVHRRSLQRQQIRHQVGQLVGGELARRTTASATSWPSSYSLRSAFDQRHQPFLLVDQLHGEGVLVQPPAADRLAVAGHDAHRAVDRQHRARRIEQRALQRGRRARSRRCRSGPARRAGRLPFTRWHVAQPPFPSNTACPRPTWPTLHRGAADVEAGADERDEAVELRRLQLEAGHARVGQCRS